MPADTGSARTTTGTVGGTPRVGSQDPAPRPDEQGNVPVVDRAAMGGNETGTTQGVPDAEAPLVTSQVAVLNEYPYPGMPAAHVVWKGEKRRIGSQGGTVTLNVPTSDEHTVPLDGIVDKDTGDPVAPLHIGGQTYTFLRGIARRVHKDHVGFFRDHPDLNFDVKDEE